MANRKPNRNQIFQATLNGLNASGKGYDLIASMSAEIAQRDKVKTTISDTYYESLMSEFRTYVEANDTDSESPAHKLVNADSKSGKSTRNKYAVFIGAEFPTLREHATSEATANRDGKIVDAKKLQTGHIIEGVMSKMKDQFAKVIAGEMDSKTLYADIPNLCTRTAKEKANKIRENAKAKEARDANEKQHPLGIRAMAVVDSMAKLINGLGSESPALLTDDSEKARASYEVLHLAQRVAWCIAYQDQQANFGENERKKYATPVEPNGLAVDEQTLRATLENVQGNFSLKKAEPAPAAATSSDSELASKVKMLEESLAKRDEQIDALLAAFNKK